MNTVAELFLLSVQEFASQQIQVAGILAEEPTMRGRVIQQKPILGTVDELPNILQSLEVHGVTVDRIVVATAKDRLLPRALETLLEVEKSSNIVVHFLSERLGFNEFLPNAVGLIGTRRLHRRWTKATFSGWGFGSCEFRTQVLSAKANS